MPKAFVEKDIADIQTVDLMEEKTIKTLADKYQVSTHAFAFRLAYLGYVQQ